MTASKTVLQGKRFVSASLVGHEGGNPTSKHTADKNALVHLPPRNVEIGHEVEFYADDAAFVAGFAGCIEAVLQAGNAVIVIATEPHRSGILERLEADGVNIRTHAEQERFIQLDAHEALSTLMLDDAPDRVHFRKLLDDLIARAAKSRDGEHPRVAICGECAPMLLADGKEGATIQVEHLWGAVSRAYRVDTLCGYLRSAFPQEASSLVLEKVCAEHSAVHGRKLGY